jgi:N-dimethylarginine dimethylaminohydrolase
MTSPNNSVIPTQFSSRERYGSVLMVSPEHYDISYVINPFMEGMLGSVDQALACTQWQALREVYEGLGYSVSVIEGVHGQPDMVFAANQSLAFLNASGERTVVMARMNSPYRRGEIQHFVSWYEAQGYQVIMLDDGCFEGTGDARWHPGRRLLYVGYGYRTDERGVDGLRQRLDVPVMALQLVDPRFYHLDTAFAPLDEVTALFVKEAFTSEGIAILRAMFPRLVAVPLAEAIEGLSCNGHSPDDRHYLVQAGNKVTNKAVSALGYTVIEVDTSEFIKSGGSVYCMKMMLP